MKRALYHIYRRFHVLETWIRRKLTPGGLLAMAVLITTAVLGLDTTRSMIFQVFALTLPLVTVAFISTLFFKIKISTERDLPKYATVNEKLKYRIRIQNHTNSPQRGLSLFETPEDPRPSFQEFCEGKDPEEMTRNLWDRKVKYFRWLWLIRQNRKAWFHEKPVPDLPPQGSDVMEAELVPLSRGYIRLSGTTVTRKDPFGLFKAFHHIKSSRTLLVLPKRYEVPFLNLPGTRQHHAGGIALASSVGNSDEFMNLRDYVNGDPIRHIHWKSYAKTGKLVIREFQDEYFIRHALILDTFQPDSHSDNFEEAVSVASSFACSMQMTESVLDLLFVGNRAYSFTSGRGLGSMDRMMEILACITPCTDKSPSSLLPHLDRFIPLLSGALCIFLTWDNERIKILEQLEMHGISVIALVITSTPEKWAGKLGKHKQKVHLVQTGSIQEGLMQI